MFRVLFPLYLIVFLAGIGYSSMITIFTPMMMDESWGIVAASDSLRVRMTELGVLLALYPLGQFLGSPIIVNLAGRFDKKRILLISLCFTAAAYAFVALSLQALNLAGLMASVFFAGVSEGNESIAEDRIAELTQKEHHKKLMSYLHASSSCAFLAGPILSGFLSQKGLAAPFWGIFILMAIGLFFTLFMPHIPGRIHPIRKSADMLSEQIPKFSYERFHFAFAINFLIYFAIFGFFRAYPMHLVQAFQFDIYQLSFYIAWVALPIAVLNLFLTTYLLKRFEPSTILALGSLGIGVFIPFFIFVNLGVFLWVSLFLVATSIAICLPTSLVYIARSAQKSIIGEILESDLAILKGAETVASLSGGALAAIFIPLPLYFFAGVAIAAAALLFFKRKNPS